MIRKIIAAALALAACATSAYAQTAASIANANTDGFSRPPAPALLIPTAVRLSVPAVSPIVPDRFRVTVMFDATGANRADLERSADEALAKVAKAASSVAGVKASLGARHFNLEPDMRCTANGHCVSAGVDHKLHAELELVADNEAALIKALSEARKATGKDHALNATAISVEHSDAAFESARRNAVVSGQRALEDAAAALTKEGGRWHITSIEFEERNACNAMKPAPKEVPPSMVMTTPGAGLPPPAPARTCANSKPGELELRATGSIMIFPPPPKP